MNDNRREMKDTAKSKRLALHMVIDLQSPSQVQNHINALIEEMALHAHENVNVGWRVYGQPQSAIIRDCMKMPKKIREEACFGDRLGKEHMHIRVSQMFDRSFLVTT